MLEQPTPAARMIPVAEISPDSTVNVRRSDINENRDRLKDSIERNGFLPEHPILLRPHPQPDHSAFQYETVSGQSRFLAARDLGIQEVPAVIVAMDDETAHLRSFVENDKRGDLSTKDKTYWFERKFKEFRATSTSADALQMTAALYAVSEATVQNYLTLAVLPDEVQDDVESKVISQEAGKAIARRPWQYAGDAASKDDMMIAAAEWFKSLPHSQRKDAVAAIKQAPPTASQAQHFQDELERQHNSASHTFDVKIPTSMVDPLTRYAAANGYANPEQVIPMIISSALAAAGMEMLRE